MSAGRYATLDAAWTTAQSAPESGAWTAAQSGAEGGAWNTARSGAEGGAWTTAQSAPESGAWTAAQSGAEGGAWNTARSGAEGGAWTTEESTRSDPDGDTAAGQHAADGSAGKDMRQRLAQLRDSFDQSFADPHREQVAGFDDLLAIRVGGHRYALRLTQAAGLFPDRPVTRLPGPLPALLGVASFRGSIVPVYDLGAVFGHPAPTARWLVLAAGEPAVALAFEELDGHLRVPRDVIVEESTGHGPRGCLRGLVPLDGGARPIVDVPAVRAAIQTLTGSTSSTRDTGDRQR